MVERQSGVGHRTDRGSGGCGASSAADCTDADGCHPVLQEVTLEVLEWTERGCL
jgi:hypothetical protein